MNKIFKSIWNEQTGTYVAVSENTRSKGKKSSSTLCTALAVVLGTFPLSAQAWEWHISDGTNQNSISTLLTGQTATFSGDGKNISTELSNRKLTVKLKDDLDLTSVKTGDSTLNSSGLSITGGPSVTAAGIAAGGKAITGVAMSGTPLDTDAVNVDYLNTQIDANKTRYYSVKSSETGPGSNYDNDGATGTNAMAAGVGASAKGNHAIAIGEKANASNYQGLALGYRADAKNANRGIAIGPQANTSLTAGIAMGWNAASSQVNATAIGTDSIAKGKSSIALGHSAQAGGDYVVAIGKNAGFGTISNRNNIIGTDAGINITDIRSVGNNIMGNQAGVGLTSDDGINKSFLGFGPGANTLIGNKAGFTMSGDGNVAIGNLAGAVGTNQKKATGDNNVYMGHLAGAGSSSDRTIIIGSQAGDSTSNDRSIFIGNYANGNVASPTRNAIAIGSTSTALDKEAIAIGFNTKAQASNAMALGRGAIAGELGVDESNDIAMGTAALATGKESVAIGNTSKATGYRSVSLGLGTSATGDSATALGSGAQAFAGSTTAVGSGARADKYGATAVGVNSRAWGRYSAAFGQTAVANNDYDVALGSGSETDTAVASEDIIINGKTYGFAGITPLSTVSVGKVGSERTITNVAAGRISDTSTDAINGSQLFQTNQAIGDLTQSIVAAIGGVGISDGGITKPSYTIGEQTFDTISGAINFMANGWYFGTTNTPANPIPGGGEGGSTTTPPAEPTSPEAPIQVRPGDKLTLVGGDNINITQDTEAKEITIATDPNLVVNSVTAGQTVMDNSGVSVGDNVHLGETGLIINGGPSVTTDGINAGNLVVTNVAAGSIGAESTDAINGSQIHAINTSVANAFGGGSTVQEDGTVSAPSYTVGSKDTVVNNVGDAIGILNQGWMLTAGGNDSQVQSGDVVSLSNNDGNIVITHAADSGAVAFDLNENITVNNVNATTVNTTTVNASTVRAGNTVINNSGVSFVNEGGEPVGPSMRPDGIDAGGYPIANVAPGVRPTDAANMGQLSQAVNTINHRIDRVENRADAGTAAAMAVAGLGQPYRPGQSMVSLGSGLWRGETGYALGISTLSSNGKWLIKGAATSSSRGGVGGSASINYAW